VRVWLRASQKLKRTWYNERNLGVTSTLAGAALDTPQPSTLAMISPKPRRTW
jgi:hypothetical protein